MGHWPEPECVGSRPNEHDPDCGPAPRLLGWRDLSDDTAVTNPQDLFPIQLKNLRSCTTNDNARSLLDELEALAAGLSDPARHAAVRRIIARLSDRDGAWPDAEELARLRLECHDEPK